MTMDRVHKGATAPLPGTGRCSTSQSRPQPADRLRGRLRTRQRQPCRRSPRAQSIGRQPRPRPAARTSVRNCLCAAAKGCRQRRWRGRFTRRSSRRWKRCGRASRKPLVSIPHNETPLPHQHSASVGAIYALALRAAVAIVAPAIGLRFDTVTSPVGLEDDLHDGNVDLAIDWLPIEWEPYVNRKLFDDRLVLLARRDHPIAKSGRNTQNLGKHSS